MILTLKCQNCEWYLIWSQCCCIKSRCFYFWLVKLWFSSLDLSVFWSFYTLTPSFLFYHAFLISFVLLLQACLCDSRPSGGCGWNPSCGSQCQFLASQWFWLYHQSARWKVCPLLLIFVGGGYWHIAIGISRTHSIWQQ